MSRKVKGAIKIILSLCSAVWGMLGTAANFSQDGYEMRDIPWLFIPFVVSYKLLSSGLGEFRDDRNQVL